MSLNVSTAFTDGTGSDAIQSFFDRLLLERGTYDLIHNIAFMKKDLAQREGKTMIWRRYEALGLATTALGEGVPPSPRSRTKTDISATIALYGDYIEDTDLLLNTQPEAVATENIELQGQQMGETFDQIGRDRLATATNIVYSNGSSTVTVTEVPDRNDLDRLHRLLKVNKAKEFNPMIMASQKIGTLPISRSFWGLCDENLAFDLRHIDGFVLASEYANSTGLVAGEFGADKNGIRFLSSPNGYKTTGASGTTAAGTNVKNTGGYVDVYSLFVCGQHAVASIDLAGSNGGTIRKGVGTSGVSDPLNQRATTGWKKYYQDVVLNQNFFAQLKACASL
jgi:N4-gp56 family major capsid protein